MRHLKRTAKLGRTGEHRNAMLANLVRSLIKHKRIRTTLAKAKAARSVAEKIVTLGKRGTLHARRLAAARLRAHGPTVQLSKARRQKWRQNEDVVRILFEDIAPSYKDRPGGYTRIVRLGGITGPDRGRRQGDAAKMAILEWVDLQPIAAPAPETKSAEAAKAGEEAKPGEPKSEAK